MQIVATFVRPHTTWRSKRAVLQAARKLGVPTETVEDGLNSLGFLMLEVTSETLETRLRDTGRWWGGLVGAVARGAVCCVLSPL